MDFKLMWRDPQPKWVSPASHVVQLGDAAHTFMPSSGNGGTQALEDAISLATCPRTAGREKIAQATRVHNVLRFQRVSCLQAFGVVSREARNTAKNKGESKVKPTLGKWLVEHDPEAYARSRYEEAAKCVEDGTEAEFNNTNSAWTDLCALDYGWFGGGVGERRG
jgi:2-polyprenyl-6-methoxyphenol hydroxylase-like FAD-dependent oxidoreductase